MKDLKEISKMLAARAESVCIKLLPHGKRHGQMWICGDLSGSEGKSLQVNLEGDNQGRWRDWAEGDLRGDLIDLWREVKGLTPKQAIAEVREYLGLVKPMEVMKPKSYSKAQTDHAEINPTGSIVQWFSEERKIEPAIVNRFKIKGCSKDKKTFIVFPCFDPSGEWINSSYRSLKPDENGKKKVFQDKGCAPCLFGWHGLDERAYEKRKVLLCEGQIDCMTWTQWGVDALSIPNGSGTTWIEFEWENLEVFDTIYLSFDMDGKTSDALQKVVSRLGKHRCMIVKLPHKDANDCLKAGCISWEALEWLDAAKPAPVPDFVMAADLRQRVMNAFFPPPDAKGCIQPPLLKAGSTEKSFKIRPGEVTVWSGISSHGKTTFLAQLFMELMLAGENCMVASMEMKPEAVIKKMCLCYARTDCITKEMVEKFMDSIGGFLCFCDVIGNMQKERLLEMMEFAYARYGTTQFLIDSLMKIQGLDEDYPAQGEYMNTLTNFAKTRGVHIHLVAHPRKTQNDERPSGNDLKGSSMLRNCADNVGVVIRNMTKEKKVEEGEMEQEEADQEWDTMVAIEKDREEGLLKSFKYRYHWRISRYELIQKSHVKVENIYANGRNGNHKKPIRR